ncbi:MAG TPA: nucleoside transporter C-terminal domain-containing protein [Opitutaceae bacterium]
MELLTHLGRGLLGMALLIGFLSLFSVNRRAIQWRTVAIGVGLQVLLAMAIFWLPFVKPAIEGVASFFVQVLEFSKAGAAFLFGGLVTNTESFGFIFAFNVLPTIIFVSALTSALYYLGILQRIVYALAWVMAKTMRLSGAESLSAAANVFVGQTEAPLVIKPYLEKMTRSEILCVMIGGMATIAGGVLAAYIGMLGGTETAAKELFALHLLTASMLNAPAAIIAAKILLPETEAINRELLIPRERIGSNLLDAISNGTTDGLRLAFNVAAMLLVFIAMIALVNYTMAHTVGNWTGLNDWVAGATAGRYSEFNLQFIFGFVFAPAAWAIGIPNADLLVAGQLLGEKLVINEFVAYASLSTMKSTAAITEPVTVILMTYALCGFANFSSIGIQIGGISALAPGQRENLVRLGMRALLGGTVACLLTACVARLFVG